MLRRDRLCLYMIGTLALAWAVTLTAMVASLLIEQREHAAALGLLCHQRRRGPLSLVPFVRRRGVCEEDDDPSLPPALQKALPFLKPLKRKILRLPIIGAGAAYLLQFLPIAGPWLHFVGVSLTRYVMPVAKKVEALFLVLKLSKEGWALGIATNLKKAMRWLRGSSPAASRPRGAPRGTGGRGPSS